MVDIDMITIVEQRDCNVADGTPNWIREIHGFPSSPHSNYIHVPGYSNKFRSDYKDKPNYKRESSIDQVERYKQKPSRYKHGQSKKGSNHNNPRVSREDEPSGMLPIDNMYNILIAD